MHKGTIYKFLRCLLCLILVCCILINCSPIRAEATVVGGIIAGEAAAGVLGWLFSAAMGVVFVDLTYDFLTSIGNDVRSHVKEYYQNDIETTNTVIGYLDGLSYDFGGSDDGTNNDDSSNDKNMLTHLPTALFVALMDWAQDLINGGGIDVEEEIEIPDGYASYNGHILPYSDPALFNTPYPYSVIIYNSSTSQYTFYHSQEPGYWYKYYRYEYCAPSGWRYIKLTEGETKWTYGGVTLSSNGILRLDENNIPYCFYGDLIWSSYDIYDFDGALYFPGSSINVSENQTITVTPNTYVGDIPQKVQDGTFDDDEYQLSYINPTPFFQNQTDVVDALNNVATQLEDQTMTYEQYMEQIQTDGDSGEDPGNNPGQDPDPELGMYALDLKKFFPFCIPFDLYDFLTCLAAEPVAPVIEWVIPVPGGDAYPLELDLSPFDSVAQLLRRLQLLLFCIGLAVKTRDLIKG